MASSIFGISFGVTFDGSNTTVTGALLLADGTPAAPSLAYASQPGLGWMKAASGVMDFMSPSYSVSIPMFRLAGSVGPTIASNIALLFVSSGGAAGTPTFSMRSPGAGQLNYFTTTAETTGVGIDVATDATLKIRTRAQTGYATTDTLGLKSSASAGASFGPSAVASLTTVNGIVTAAS
jgi:hypothetical protein